MSDKKQIISASPKVRKFARELGANLYQIHGSQREGRVSENDVRSFIKESLSGEIVKKRTVTSQEYEHSEFGEIDVKLIPRIKKIAGPHLEKSWSEIPHVTQHDEADITEMDEFRNSLTDNFTGEKKKITPLAFIIKALVRVLKLFPNFNSSIAEETSPTTKPIKIRLSIEESPSVSDVGWRLSNAPVWPRSIQLLRSLLIGIPRILL